ncbi:tyrosine kinase, putative [Entamoeba histolytica HM-1:IMSS-B]|uniref:Tyrosine kinase, putative n=6 Tax=Entamoeba histolytica TaxID=5759 RepID=C4M4I1_ENTH1|nr:tyrosine kinase, putative [Entamoeba histolytica HM-1:IMSS]EMD46950.1 tyrosine kinase, putative [Entamoeba histolytica KU27]EMH73999.1 tyrosine kinase, putative [Entamoeba histolytica HM-1:IMSS-B]EMS12964.1 tyrosine kinase, putative [Entamoeba histolytica HM-3:IMSS]ENY64959.1 tyrosine kinase, putative [Entamoeba histolytica HM-1:IMSS-A]GAT96280.1 tyrosine kinase putative [Entamoeba histolytica]|eukprot:XP_650137.1 tyrosine kinase, putative [Entamoeba histolytica HM-1:IMSS]
MIIFLIFASLSNGSFQCKTNEYWSQNEGVCKSCSQQCLTCWSDTKCTSCREGYYLNENYGCAQREAGLQEVCKTWDGLYCVECKEGYYIEQMKCNSCNVKNCEKCTKDKCFKCKEGYMLYEIIGSDGKEKQECIDCTNEENDDKCGKCPLGKYFDIETFSCKECRDGCERCTTKDNCYLCKGDKALKDPTDPNSECVSILHCTSGNYYGNQCELCEENYFVQKGMCVKCSDGCKRCINEKECIECNSTLSLINGECKNDINCLRSSNTMGCVECKEGYYLGNEGECKQCPVQCKLCKSDSYCFRCNDNYYFTDVSNGICNKLNNRICNVGDQYGCLQCKYDVPYNESLDKTDALKFNVPIDTSFKLGYYLPYSITSKREISYEPTCKMCNITCRICDKNPNWCTGCNAGYSLEKDTEATIKYFEDFGVYNDIYKCVKMPSICKKTEMGYCVQCDDKYFLQGVDCKVCDESCDTCLSDKSCQTCNSTIDPKTGNALWWRRPSESSLDTQSLCYSTSNLTHSSLSNCSDKITTSGCISCHSRFYLNDGECLPCPTECYECELKNNITRCTKCSPNTQYLSKEDNKCLECSTIEHCLECNEKGCTKCEDGYSETSDRLLCKKVRLGLIISLIVIGLLFIVIIICFIIFLIWRRRRKIIKEREKEIKPFKVSGGVEMALLSADNANFPLKTDKWKLTFEHAGSKVIVDNLYEETIKIINPTKKTYFFELLLGASHRYELSVEPMRFTLKPDYAVELKFKIKMICTAVVNDEIGIIAMDLDEEIKETAKISIIIESDLSTKLDHTELKLQMPAIGEGAFGMVFIGSYRGQKVAVKKMKARTLTEEQEKEFKHEVNMLTQYRHPCIVNLVGAVYTEGEISIVTEFADYGSLSKLYKKELLPFDLKIKIMEDIVVGLAFLHENNIIHRDVKGENVLIYSLNPHSQVCGKLTDFGTCRNISERALQLQPLSHGIGTPTYMAPECLANSNYSYSADVYSFAIILYETFTEQQAYIDDERFIQPWTIPQFVIEGHRLEKPNDIPENYWNLINQCWTQDPEDRLTFNQIHHILINWNLDICNTELSTNKKDPSLDSLSN